MDVALSFTLVKIAVVVAVTGGLLAGLNVSFTKVRLLVEVISRVGLSDVPTAAVSDERFAKPVVAVMYAWTFADVTFRMELGNAT